MIKRLNDFINNNNNTPTKNNNSNSNFTYLRIAYFTVFLARGSIFPFLGVILRARGCSLLSIGIAMNVSAIARLIISFVFASELMKTTLTTTTATSSSSSVAAGRKRHEFLKKVLFYCILAAIVAICAFTLTVGSPFLSACAVGGALSASSVASLVLDSLTIKMFDDEATTSRKEEQTKEPNNNSDQKVIKKDNYDKTDENDDDGPRQDASVGFGNVRLFGSLGWGIAAPFQVLLMKMLYNSHNNNSQQNDDLNTQHDFRAWFQQNSTKGIVSRNPSSEKQQSALLGTPLIFLISIGFFLWSIGKVLPSSSNDSKKKKNVIKEESIDDENNSDEAEKQEMMTSKTNEEEQEENNKEEKQNANNSNTDKKGENEVKIIDSEQDHPENNIIAPAAPELSLSSLLWSLRYALLFAILYGLCDDVVSTFLFPFLRNDLHVSSTLISIIPTVNVISELPVLYLSGWFQKNFSIYSLHALFFTLWIVRFSWYSFVLEDVNDYNNNSSADNNSNNNASSESSSFFFIDNSNFKILIIETLNGLCFAGALVLCMRHAVKISKEEIFQDVQRAIPLVHASFFGVSSAVGGVAGGALAERFGVRMVFSLVAAVCFVVVLMIGVRGLVKKLF